MPDLRELYQDVILEHSKTPRNYHELKTANHKAEGFNPLCGDRFTVSSSTGSTKWSLARRRTGISMN